MKQIKICEELKQKIPNFHIGVARFKTKVKKTTELDNLIINLQNEIKNIYELSEVLEIPNIKAARNGYKALGKDPSRYRLAVESLFRRIVKGNELYRINDIVDMGNILSLLTQRSVAVLDNDKIVGDILIRIGKEEPYEGIGRGNLNIENIPVYCDEISPFGSPTSDTERTMITSVTEEILLFIISFNGLTHLTEDLNVCKELYETYSLVSDFKTQIL